MGRFDTLPHIRARYARRCARYAPSGEWLDGTLATVFEDAVGRWPDQRWVFALPDREDELTLADLAVEAEAFARRLVATAGSDGVVVAFALPNSAPAVTSFYGTQLAGQTAFPLSMREGRESLRRLLEIVGVEHLVVAHDDEERAAFARGYVSDGLLRALWRADDAGRVWPDHEGGEGPPSTAPLPVVADGVHVVSYTSGSTSEPKLVLYTGAQLLCETRSLAQVFAGFGTILVPAPIGHITGILHLLTLPMVRPGDVISMDRWSAEGAVELCRRHGAETLAGTSLYFHAMGSVAQDLGGVRGGIAGGGPVAPAIVRSLDQDGIRLVRAYGSTEHPTITQSLPNDPLAARALTDGRPCQGVELRLLDEHGVEVPAGVAGEIFSRGPDAMAGYLDAATDAECYSEDDWFRTGDIGTVDVDGRLTISDRVKDIIIRGGENISAKEVEDALHDWSAIEEVAVIGVPDPQYGERGCAFLIPAAGVITVAEMRAYLAGTPLEKYKWPEFVVVVDGFPRTASGKVRKQTLREQWGRTNVVGQGSAR